MPKLYDKLLEPNIDMIAKSMIRQGAFDLELSSDLVRTFNRKQYHEARSWVRRLKREIIKETRRGINE